MYGELECNVTQTSTHSAYYVQHAIDVFGCTSTGERWGLMFHERDPVRSVLLVQKST